MEQKDRTIKVRFHEDQVKKQSPTARKYVQIVNRTKNGWKKPFFRIFRKIPAKTGSETVEK